MKQKKVKIPLLHKAVGTKFLEFVDDKNIITYGKLKFILRCGFRISQARVCDLVDEFCKYGILSRINQREILISEEFKVNVEG
jgi:hypothetical protein